MSSQPGILSAVPKAARYLTFSLTPGANAQQAIQHVATNIDIEHNVVGIGRSLVLAANAQLDNLRDFPLVVGPGIEVPSTPGALWLWLKGDDRGELIHRTRNIENVLGDYFQITDIVDAFQYQDSRDMTGYIDGTENPTDNEAVAAAILNGAGVGLDGSSFVAVQQWLHDMDSFEAMTSQQQDHTFGRRKSDNEELDDAPPSAHVKRTAQESFDPEAFVVRRSMPWGDSQSMGLVFVAFGKSFDAFEAQLKRMAGLEDGITDALFTFTTPISGAYYWCPPVRNGKLDVSII